MAQSDGQGEARQETGRVARRDPARALGAWLLACCGLLFLLVVVGGLTRLTHSGLSITEWRPVVGALPPASAAAWEAEFAKYKSTPEYRIVNAGMSLEEFKGIYWWEYVHRLLARLLGLAFAVPLAVFAARRRVSRRLGWQLVGILALGALQGAVGWLMVASGLVDKPHVSHLRLAAHLGLALALFAAMFWIGLELLRAGRAGATAQLASPKRLALARLGAALVALVFLQILSGALVAGTHAGLVFNTFPSMEGSFFPPGGWALEPGWANLTDNLTTIQFTHRTLAWLVLILCVTFWWMARAAGARGNAGRRAAAWLLAAVGLQFALGVSTLLLHVPVALAAAHQAGAVLLLAAALAATHAVAAPGRGSLPS